MSQGDGLLKKDGPLKKDRSLKKDRLLKEEHSVYIEHKDDYKEYTAAMRNQWLNNIYMPSDSPEVEDNFMEDQSEYMSDLEGTITRDVELMKMYIAGGISLAAERGRELSLPEESTDAIRRKAYIELTQADSREDIREVSMRAAYELRRLYLNCSMRGMSHIVRQAVEEIHRCRYTAAGTGLIAERIGVNPSYLSRVFHEETGMTLTDYICRLKMEEAAALYKGHLYSLNEISELLGYRDYSYFSKVFKKFYGVSPENFER